MHLGSGVPVEKRDGADDFVDVGTSLDGRAARVSRGLLLLCISFPSSLTRVGLRVEASCEAKDSSRFCPAPNASNVSMLRAHVLPVQFLRGSLHEFSYDDVPWSDPPFSPLYLLPHRVARREGVATPHDCGCVAFGAGAVGLLAVRRLPTPAMMPPTPPPRAPAAPTPAAVPTTVLPGVFSQKDRAPSSAFFFSSASSSSFFFFASASSSPFCFSALCQTWK